MTPKATRIGAPRDGLRHNLIALILTFSHPGEGTLVRYIIGVVKRSTQSARGLRTQDGYFTRVTDLMITGSAGTSW